MKDLKDFHKYEVRFWYHTDLRYSVEVLAIDYVQALVFGLAGVKGQWVDEYPFRVEIKALTPAQASDA